ncbi:magnesium and cobalt transport protein CorA [halophilic archaeon]|nr:magnesium and cobalt transport protein CorA [halophilic archaeon]
MITALTYTDDEVRRFDDPAAARDAPGTAWVRATGATLREINRVADAFGIHPLSVEDVRNGVRAKTEEFDDHAFVLLKTADLVVGDTTFDEEIRTESVGVFVGDDWLVTLSEYEIATVDRAWNAVERDGRLRSYGPDFAAYRIVDGIVDAYFEELDQIETRIEEVEDSIIDDIDVATLEAINGVRRELLSFRKLLWPTREAVGVLARGDPDQVRAETEKYFRDAYDHVVQLVDLTETYRDLASGARDIYLNSLSMSTNEVMKKLTVVATIVLPLTFVVGVYGMNFEGSPYNMPELGWQFGYPAVMLGMLCVTVVLVAYFRESGWL